MMNHYIINICVCVDDRTDAPTPASHFNEIPLEIVDSDPPV